MSEAQLKARDRHLAHVHSLLSSYGIKWSASRVSSLVKRYENEPHEKYTIDEYLHRALFAHALTDRCPTTRPVINYRDKTGEDAVYRVLKKQMRG